MELIGIFGVIQVCSQGPARGAVARDRATGRLDGEPVAALRHLVELRAVLVSSMVLRVVVVGMFAWSGSGLG
jgi:hypothetical protein